MCSTGRVEAKEEDVAEEEVAEEDQVAAEEAGYLPQRQTDPQALKEDPDRQQKEVEKFQSLLQLRPLIIEGEGEGHPEEVKEGLRKMELEEPHWHTHHRRLGQRRSLARPWINQKLL